jgi:hypothetical protein
MMGGAFELLLTVIYRVGPVMYDGMLGGGQENEVLVTKLNTFIPLH